jgi:hypothetical protein
VPRASSLLSLIVGWPPLAEADIRTSCPSCGLMQRLDEALYFDADPLETAYRCAACAEPILVVSTAGVVPWEGRGTTIRDWQIRNPTELRVSPYHGTEEIVFEAAPDALA